MHIFHALQLKFNYLLLHTPQNPHRNQSAPTLRTVSGRTLFLTTQHKTSRNRSSSTTLLQELQARKSTLSSSWRSLAYATPYSPAAQDHSDKSMTLDTDTNVIQTAKPVFPSPPYFKRNLNFFLSCSNLVIFSFSTYFANSAFSTKDILWILFGQVNPSIWLFLTSLNNAKIAKGSLFCFLIPITYFVAALRRS